MAWFLFAAMFEAIPRAVPAEAGPGENRWEARIRAFEEKDRQGPPPKQGILFIGSSSIVGWDLARYFPDLPVINRGFGGSVIADSVHFAERIVLPYEPKIVVLYAGDNDIARGKSPQQVLADYKQFVNTIRKHLPETRIVFVAIKPSLKRWHLVGKMREANRLIEACSSAGAGQTFVDIDRPMIGSNGEPRAELFKADGLHLNAAGYELWSKLVRPHLERNSLLLKPEN
jgi:lysophospholipase L1-like esterase